MREKERERESTHKSNPITILRADSHGSATMTIERLSRSRGKGLFINSDGLGGAIEGCAGGSGVGALLDGTLRDGESAIEEILDYVHPGREG